MSTDMLMLPMLPVVRFSAVAEASDLSSAGDRETAGIVKPSSTFVILSKALPHVPRLATAGQGPLLESIHTMFSGVKRSGRKPRLTSILQLAFSPQVSVLTEKRGHHRQGV